METPSQNSETPDVLDIARALFEKIGAVVQTASLYGEKHRLTVETLAAALPLREKLAAANVEISVRVVDGELILNGLRQPKGTRFLQMFIDRLESHNFESFSLLPGLSEDEFVNLVDLLLTPPPAKGGPDMREELAARGLEHIQAREAVYVQIEEDETVVKKDDVLGKGDGGEGGGESGAPRVEVQQIMAFLRGDVAGTKAGVEEEFRRIAADPAKLAELLLDATAIRKSPSELSDGENLGDFLVGCLRRTFVKLRREPGAASIKGKKALRKTVILLEKEVLKRLRNMADQAPPDIEERVAAAFGEMQDAAEVEALAAEYTHRLRAFERSEQKLLKYLEKHPAAAASDGAEPAAATGGGVPAPPGTAAPAPAGWQRIQVTGPAAAPATPGTPTGPAAAPGASDGMGVLALLLTELDRLMHAGGADPEKKKIVLRKREIVLRRIESEVESIGKETTRLIREFDGERKRRRRKRKAAGKAAPTTPDADEMAREQEFLAEIVQELCQLAVALNGAMSILARGCAGDMPAEHSDVLGIAVRSGNRLADLLELLRSRIGLPSTLTPVDVLAAAAAERS